MNKIQTAWNLDLLFSKKDQENIKEYREKVEKKVNGFIQKWRDNSFTNSPAKLAEALTEYNELSSTTGLYDHEIIYYNYAQVLDQQDTELRSKFNKVHELFIGLANQIKFFTIGISQIDPQRFPEFLNAPELKEFHHFIEHLFNNAKYILSEKEEIILNLKSKVSHSNWVEMLETLMSKEEAEIIDKDGKKQTKNFSEILDLISDKDKKVRDDAAKHLNKIFKKYIDVGEHEFNSILENKKINDGIRGYERADSARLISDDMETDTVDTLISTITNRFDIAKRYYDLKAKLMGVKKLEYHERNVDYGEIDKKYKFDESYDLVKKVFNKLDSRFESEFVKFFEEGRVDVFPKKGKRSGAFCSSGSWSIPTIVMLNHLDSLDNVTTMAHEFGHAIHYELAKEHNNALQFEYGMAIAETASTFCEDFVLDEILSNADDELRLVILMNKLNSDVSTIFRQISFYNFETEVHNAFREKGYLSKEEIGTIFQKHMISYMGDAVDQPADAKNWWLYIPHFRYMFYVYSYAFGQLISKALQGMVKTDSTQISKVKKFMSAGGSDTPKNVFKSIGIDITDKNFWDKGLDEIDNLLKETEQLAIKLGKID